MTIKIQSKFVKEDIIDENGNKLGEISFNPSDSRIMNKLSDVLFFLEGKYQELKKLGDFHEIENRNFESIEEFENQLENFKKIAKGFELEDEANSYVINTLMEIFGEETIAIFTGGTNDLMLLMPLLDFVIPYVRKARTDKVNHYIIKKNDDVMK